ncbi:glutamyl-tRNA reductase [Microterricola viridarii]|uniref:Glutamyl-tRNA reductase n=1 Tax=Microterricola viridarii TaxID=412690 RepID=A0A1H1LS56_9MICO|nr:glutamyl-tRNA reductase [Microterricola viridarii]SDR76815.1 glutamyl-tRNA reductase [Microterricola viridarii]
MLICLSASHKNSHFDLLEQLSVDSASMGERIVQEHRALSGGPALAGAVVVATCNRFETYLDLNAPFGVSPLPTVFAAIEAVSASTGVDAQTLRESLDLVHGNGVAEHLFAVSSGLESVVVGEGEIAGQVRRSLEQARSVGTTSPELERLFQRASQTSRGVKNRTGIGSAGRSLVRLSLELAESRISDWSATSVLLVGTGRYAGASLAALRDRGAEDIRVYSPSGRAARFAANHDIAAVQAADYAAVAASVDVVVTCTTAETHVIDAALLGAGREVLGAEAAGRQLLIDLGLPRNIDPDVAGVEGVELLDLETIRIHAPLEELNATHEARAMVGQAARSFSAATEEQSLAPAVVALRSHIFGLLDAEIERARVKGDPDGRIEQSLRHLAGVLLHTPMTRSRELARAGEQQAWLDGLEAVFGLQVKAPDAAAGGCPITGRGAATA